MVYQERTDSESRQKKLKGEERDGDNEKMKPVKLRGL